MAPSVLSMSMSFDGTSLALTTNLPVVCGLALKKRSRLVESYQLVLSFTFLVSPMRNAAVATWAAMASPGYTNGDTLQTGSLFGRLGRAGK
jgi:hypothetical protein